MTSTALDTVSGYCPYITFPVGIARLSGLDLFRWADRNNISGFRSGWVAKVIKLCQLHKGRRWCLVSCWLSGLPEIRHTYTQLLFWEHLTISRLHNTIAEAPQARDLALCYCLRFPGQVITEVFLGAGCPYLISMMASEMLIMKSPTCSNSLIIST